MEAANNVTPVKNKRLSRIIEIPASPFMKTIGFGTGVAVYTMQRSPISNRIRSPWAIKKLTRRYKTNITSKQLDKRIQEEAKVLRQLNHPNIVGFRALVQDSQGSSILAMEECSGCLGGLIENRIDKLGEVPFPAKIIIKVAYDTAKALDYIHNEALLLHCDVKSYNILIKGNFEICKLCDFGVCLPLTPSGDLDRKKAGDDAEYVGTPSWCSPEILEYPQLITTKADVYAYGLTIYEMIALCPPVDDNLLKSFNDTLESFNDADVDDEAIDESLDKTITKMINEVVRQRPSLPEVELGPEYNTILEIYFCCTAEELTKRPTARDLTCVLRDIEQDHE